MYLLFTGYSSIRYSYLWVEVTRAVQTLTLPRPVGVTTVIANDLRESTLVLRVLSTLTQF